MAESMMVTGMIVAFGAGFMTAVALIATSTVWSRNKSDKK